MWYKNKYKEFAYPRMSTVRYYCYRRIGGVRRDDIGGACLLDLCEALSMGDRRCSFLLLISAFKCSGLP